MAYSTSVPPVKILQGDLGNQYPCLWAYRNTDALATVVAAGYITNAKALGMKVGDVVNYLKTDTSAVSMFSITAISAGGASTGSAGVAI